MDVHYRIVNPLLNLTVVNDLKYTFAVYDINNSLVFQDSSVIRTQLFSNFVFCFVFSCTQNLVLKKRYLNHDLTQVMVSWLL